MITKTGFRQKQRTKIIGFKTKIFTVVEGTWAGPVCICCAMD